MLAERISCNFPNVALANFGPHFLDVLGNASFSAYIFVGSAPFAKHIPRFPTRHDEATHDDLPKLVGKFFKKSPPGCGQRLFFFEQRTCTVRVDHWSIQFALMFALLRC